jgi:two-component system phosphate regulon sensor histidine kinase PhoR
MVTTILGGIGFLLYAIRKERRANQLKSDFIANVSHELKTPLSLIRMFAELLALGKLKTPEKGREYAEIITRESERLSHLIDNVLDFARIERGKAAYDFKMGDLAEVVARGVDVYRFRLEREGVKLRTEIAEALPPIRLDENAMTLVLLNLLDNAVKYGAGEGDAKGEITVRLGEEGGALRLTVADQGPGIEREEQRHIFERFYRARSARGKTSRGSGIGLSLVKHIAEAHGGRVTVDSAPGRGATFIVSLPIGGETEPEEEAA